MYCEAKVVSALSRNGDEGLCIMLEMVPKLLRALSQFVLALQIVVVSPLMSCSMYLSLFSIHIFFCRFSKHRRQAPAPAPARRWDVAMVISYIYIYIYLFRYCRHVLDQLMGSQTWPGSHCWASRISRLAIAQFLAQMVVAWQLVQAGCFHRNCGCLNPWN